MNAITFDPAATTLVNVLTCDPANQAALATLDSVVGAIAYARHA
jgi:hypothetical protein